jgi:hypothetical protein
MPSNYPLLARPVTMDTGRSATSYLLPNPSEHVSVSPQGGSATKWANTTPLLHTLGWIEYILSDASFYYMHPTHRLVTDINLRIVKNLEAVGEHLDHMDPTVPEASLKDGSSAERHGGFAPLVIWIDHRKRVVSFGALSTNHEDMISTSGTGEDRECGRSVPDGLY